MFVCILQVCHFTVHKITKPNGIVVQVRLSGKISVTHWLHLRHAIKIAKWLCIRQLQDYSYHGLFVSLNICSVNYFNIFCFTKAERVQSNHLLLDTKYYVSKQW